MNVYRSSGFVTQRSMAWCIAASTQMMVNFVKHRVEHIFPPARQQRVIGYARAHDYMSNAGSDGSDPQGWAMALRYFGAGRTYAARTYGSYASAIKDAALRMRLAGKPVGLLVGSKGGNHAWVMTGFQATGVDPGHDLELPGDVRVDRRTDVAKADPLQGPLRHDAEHEVVELDAGPGLPSLQPARRLHEVRRQVGHRRTLTIHEGAFAGPGVLDGYHGRMDGPRRRTRTGDASTERSAAAARAAEPLAAFDPAAFPDRETRLAIEGGKASASFRDLLDGRPDHRRRRDGHDALRQRPPVRRSARGLEPRPTPRSSGASSAATSRPGRRSC